MVPITFCLICGTNFKAFVTLLPNDIFWLNSINLKCSTEFSNIQQAISNCQTGLHAVVWRRKLRPGLQTTFYKYQLGVHCFTVCRHTVVFNSLALLQTLCHRSSLQTWLSRVLKIFLQKTYSNCFKKHSIHPDKKDFKNFPSPPKFVSLCLLTVMAVKTSER